MAHIQQSLQSQLATISSLDELQAVETAYLGRKGKINALFSRFSDLSADDVRSSGEKINTLKSFVETRIAETKKKLINKDDNAEWSDTTLPGEKLPQGSLHMVTYAIEEIAKIFERLGFIRMSYPEIEWEHYAFDSLNMPPDHPARDDFETFFIDQPAHATLGKMVLTPHTSSGQVREMLRVKTPPMKMINIAKTYRPNWDATHVPMFHQFEGLCIDEGINITHLKGTIEHFAHAFFDEDREIRLRPFHFQFTEPSFEVDITCDICDGKGYIDGLKCKVCKSGWLELGGTGMVHPNVLKAGNIDANKYQGWAFGFGIERVFMMKQGLKLEDLRIIYSGDARFLKQF